jgi:large subunit ribosomal protein L24
MKISLGDTVVIIAGKDKGKKGSVMRVLKNENRVIVAEVNMVTKHVKKTPQAPGRKVRIEHSIHASNVMLIDPKTGKGTRVGYKIDAKGKKTRIARGSGSELVRVKVSAEDQKKAGAEKSAEPAKKKAPFWKKAGPSVASDSDTKAEAGPATSTPGHTRSAGRGS